MRQMAIPFMIGPDGAVATVSHPVITLQQRVRALCATLPTQRVMRATFGVPTTDILFDWDPHIAQEQLEAMVLEAVNQYEPRARVNGVRPTLSRDGGQIISLDVDISTGDQLPLMASTQYQVTVAPNGDVRRRS